MSELTLPPVAKSFYTMCKKCEADRYHKVLAHTSSKAAKIECEVCHSKKTYSLPKAGTSKQSIAAAAKKVGQSARSHKGQYEIYNQNKLSQEPVVYSTKSQFKETQKISHPKFGIGFVTKAYDHKIDVIFTDEVRTLMHCRV